MFHSNKSVKYREFFTQINVIKFTSHHDVISYNKFGNLRLNIYRNCSSKEKIFFRYIHLPIIKILFD
jgi:hypothetical protein